MHLTTLPPELLIQIFTNLYSDKETNILAQTCKPLYALANPHLYQTSTAKKPTEVLFWASRKGRVSTAKRCLQYGADIRAQSPHSKPPGLTPLFVSARGDHVAVVELLLSHVLAHEHEHEGYPRASPSPSATAMASIQDLTSSPGIDGSLLSFAAEHGSAQVVAYLLSRADIDTDAQDRGGATPFWRAADATQPGTLGLLLTTEGKKRPGVDVNFRFQGIGRDLGGWPAVQAVQWRLNCVFDSGDDE
ncbi:hypothetical protein BDV19DRAFT_48989 [Aspergillus venezuelensis]